MMNAGSRAASFPEKRLDNSLEIVPIAKLSGCDGRVSSGNVQDGCDGPGTTPTTPRSEFSSNQEKGSGGLEVCRRRASLELRCLGIPVRRDVNGQASTAATNKQPAVHASGANEGLTVDGTSRSGNTLEIKRKNNWSPHDTSSRQSYGVTANAGGLRMESGVGLREGKGLSSPAKTLGIVEPTRVAQSSSHLGSPGGMVAREGDTRGLRTSPVTTTTVQTGVLGQILGHRRLANGEITVTPKVQVNRGGSNEVGTSIGLKRPKGGGPPAEDKGQRDKRMVLEAVNLIERGCIAEEVDILNLSVERRGRKESNGASRLGVDANGIEIKEEVDEITVEPIMDFSHAHFNAQKERTNPREKEEQVGTDSFANQYPLLREGLSKPCLRRRGRPPKVVLQPQVRSRRYLPIRPNDYVIYPTGQPAVTTVYDQHNNTVSVVPQHRKTMSVDEVLSYYGSMQEREASRREMEGQRLQANQQRREIPVATSTETSTSAGHNSESAGHNSSLAQIENLVQNQIPTTAGFFSGNATRYGYVPNGPSSTSMLQAYANQVSQYQMVPGQNSGYYGMRYRGRGRLRSRGRPRGRPRGNSGVYYHGSEREILPKMELVPHRAEDVEEIVVEVDFKPDWDDEKEVDNAKDDSLLEAQKLVPNWISVVPAKPPQDQRPVGRSDHVRNPAQGSGGVYPTGGGIAWGMENLPSPAMHRLNPQPEEKGVVQRQDGSEERGHRERTPPLSCTADAAALVSQKKKTKTASKQRSQEKLAESTASWKMDPSEKESSSAVIGSETNMETDKSCTVVSAEMSSPKADGSPVVRPRASGGRRKTEARSPSQQMQDGTSQKEASGADGKCDAVEVRERTMEFSSSVDKERQHNNRLKQLASSLASIKSLPKDVTVIRSRGKPSLFDEGQGRSCSSSTSSSSSFPESVAARLGPSIEIRRVGKPSVKGEEVDGGGQPSADDGMRHVLKQDILPALPRLSAAFPKILFHSNNLKRSEAEGSPEMLSEDVPSDEHQNVKSESPELSDPAVSEEAEGLEDQDETYQPRGYRGTGQRRRRSIRRSRVSSSSGMAPEPKQPRKRRIRKVNRAVAKVKVEEEERPGDWDVFVCDLCGRSFSKRFRLAHHIRAYHPKEGTLKGEDGRRVFPCQQCSKAFTRKANLKKHLRIHTGEKPFVCEECGRAFTFSKNLAQHRRVHGMERPFVCEVCGHAFRFSKNLSQHRGVHAHLKPHVCNVCGRGFTRSTHLSQHKRLHSGEKPFRCSVCGKRFAQRGHAALHTRIHTGERPYACPVCGRSFSLRAHLVRHVALHQRDGEMGPGRPPPLPRRDRRGRDGVEIVGKEEEGEETVEDTTNDASREDEEVLEDEERAYEDIGEAELSDSALSESVNVLIVEEHEKEG